MNFTEAYELRKLGSVYDEISQRWSYPHPFFLQHPHTVPYEGDNFANSKWIISLIIGCELLKKWLECFFMSMLNREVYLKVKKAKTTMYRKA